MSRTHTASSQKHSWSVVQWLFFISYKFFKVTQKKLRGYAENHIWFKHVFISTKADPSSFCMYCFDETDLVIISDRQDQQEKYHMFSGLHNREINLEAKNNWGVCIRCPLLFGHFCFVLLLHFIFDGLVKIFCLYVLNAGH